MRDRRGNVSFVRISLDSDEQLLNQVLRLLLFHEKSSRMLTDLVDSERKYVQAILAFHHLSYSLFLIYHASKNFPDSTLSSSGN